MASTARMTVCNGRMDWRKWNGVRSSYKSIGELPINCRGAIERTRGGYSNDNNVLNLQRRSPRWYEVNHRRESRMREERRATTLNSRTPSHRAVAMALRLTSSDRRTTTVPPLQNLALQGTFDPLQRRRLFLEVDRGISVSLCDAAGYIMSYRAGAQAAFSRQSRPSIVQIRRASRPFDPGHDSSPSRAKTQFSRATIHIQSGQRKTAPADDRGATLEPARQVGRREVERSGQRERTQPIVPL